jgi:hypothetical protein|tara:strand:+ start:76 stop:396 length:321 start_codon:yes stop_codon:yes gene_type:complete
MKKITWSVAALLIAGTTLFGQVNDEGYEDEVETFKSIEHQIDDIIDAIRMDMHYGHLDRNRGMFYINEVLAIKSKNRDIMADLHAREVDKQLVQNIPLSPKKVVNE